MIHTENGRITELSDATGIIWTVGVNDVRVINYFEGITNNEPLAFAAMLCNTREGAICTEVKSFKVEFD